MTYMDHMIVLIIAVLYPIYGRLAFPRILERIRRGGAAERMRAYKGTIAGQWLLFALVMVAWIKGGRGLGDLGLAFRGGPGFLVSMAAVLALTVGLWSQVSTARSTREVRDSVRRQLASVAALIPRTMPEYRLFLGLSATAGLCEEVLFRGFLIWYLAQWSDLATAALLSSLLFGLAHSYQGARGVGRTALVGLGLAALYMLSGSLWLPIIAHFAIDALSGLAGLRVLGIDDEKEDQT